MGASDSNGQEHRLGPNAMVVAYAMSRLDRSLLEALGYQTWTAAFAGTGAALGVPHNSMKLLRDEFDVFFPNGRRGWILREPHPSRLAILREFESVSDAALLEVVRRTLDRDQESLKEVMELISSPALGVSNVAERLLTGRRAEEHFMRFSREIVDVPPSTLIDLRNAACGFDFSTDLLPGVAIEVKGLKALSGGILFTEREWTEAQVRRQDYWVVVVGAVPEQPIAKVFRDPVTAFEARCSVVKASSTVWTARATVA